MKNIIYLIIVLMGLGLILLGIFFPLTREYVVQQVFGIYCLAIALGIKLGECKELKE